MQTSGGKRVFPDRSSFFRSIFERYVPKGSLGADNPGTGCAFCLLANPYVISEYIIRQLLALLIDFLSYLYTIAKYIIIVTHGNCSKLFNTKSTSGRAISV